MTSQPETSIARPQSPGPRPARPHRRRWWRWIGAGVAALVVAGVAAVAAFIELGPPAAPLTLPAGRVAPPSGPLGGSWQAGPGSVAGFRVAETALGLSNEVGGRTSAVTGTVVIAGRQVTSAAFRVDLRPVTVGGKHQPQFAVSLGTREHPFAVVALAGQVSLSPSFAAGSTFTARVPARVTMNGITRTVVVTLTARRSGSALQVAGSFPVEFARWHIRQPQGFGPLGSLASHGDGEFRLALARVST